MYKFKIETLSCMSCFHNIEDALKDFDPEINARVDVKNQILTIESNENREKLVAIIEAAGYPVKPGPF